MAFAAEQNEVGSEAETVLNEGPRGSGDAASELEKLRQSRRKQGTTKLSIGSGHRLRFEPSSGGVGGASFHGGNSISPTTLTDGSLPTPSTDSKGHGIRCVCNRIEAPREGDGFMLLW